MPLPHALTHNSPNGQALPLTQPPPPTPTPLLAAFLVVADEAFGRQIPFAFLENVQEEWFTRWADKGKLSIAHSLDKTFGWVGEGCTA